MKISLMMLTIDRFEVTVQTFRQVMEAARVNLHPTAQLELLVCDNGSLDKRLVSFFANQGCHYQRINMRNEGVGKAFNQLFLRSTGKFCAFIGNDIEMPAGWLNAAIQMLTWVPKPGLIGFDWGHGHTPPMSKKFNIDAHWLTPTLNRVFGNWVFRRELVEDMGLFHEGYGPYGIEDSDVNERANRLGYNSCYLPNMRSRHVVWDNGQQTEYRKMKDKSLSDNCTIFGERLKAWDAGTLPLREPLPPMRDVLI